MQNLDTFFDDQLKVWPLAAKNYSDLKNASHKHIVLKGCDYDVTFNAARMRSAAAKVDEGKVERPCFLCDAALPQEQTRITVKTVPLGNTYHIMVNPYPITDHHFTIVSAQHERQDLRPSQAPCAEENRKTASKDRIWDMAFFADLMPDYLIFFNGACSGASAPDHMHFQAVPKALVPITRWGWEQQLEAGVSGVMPQFKTAGESDKKNVVCWTDGAECHWLVIDRMKHRPSQYPDVLISPASLEFCGLVPMARQEDFDRMDSALLGDILTQCRRQEPLLRVGIMEGAQIRFSADERTHSLNYLGEDKILQVMDYGSNRAEKREISEYTTSSQPFTLEGVTIGKQFHWEQQEDQSFMGSLRVIAREGQLHAINLVPVEEYLKSVISSEMSATNNLELLKTHAIISRSWVLRTIARTSPSQPHRGGETVKTAMKERIDAAVSACEGGTDVAFVRIWDGNDHTLYDVCADDHCQRYQGITRQVSPLVAQAIEETRGMVLTDNEGGICDARFSKCCGGKSELFSSCWQERDYHYLQPVDDPWCDTSDERVLRLVLNDYDQRTIDFHNWEVHYTQSELTELVNRRLKAEIPDFVPFETIVDLVPVKRGPSGRIIILKIVGSNYSLEIGKELLIRKALSESHLYSSAFEVAIHHGTFLLKGIGWGHGVGLCQIGAANMSQHGKTHEEILAHYFKGAKITRVY